MRAPAGIHAKAAGDGPAIVLVHAGICDSGMWDAQWRTLPAAYRVVRFDMRGFGRSPLPSVAYSHARDLLAGMDAAPGRAPEDVDAAVRRRAHAMQLRALELQVPAYEADGDLEELLVPDAGDRLAEVAKPAFVLVGEADQPDIHAIAERLATGLPQARTTTIPDAAHLPSMERPELLDELVTGFVSAPA